VNCPNCLKTVDDNWTNCPFCGGSLSNSKDVIICDCGEEIESEWKICPYCKKVLAHEKLYKNPAQGAKIHESVIKTEEFVGRDKIIIESESHVVTKTGVECFTCGRLLKDDYFRCQKCKKLNCMRCEDEEFPGLCLKCADEEYELEKIQLEKEENERKKKTNVFVEQKQKEYEEFQKQREKRLVVVDDSAGLMWRKETAEGIMSWDEAMDYAKNMNFAGFTDWRLPSKKELDSIFRIKHKFRDYDKFDYWVSDKHLNINYLEILKDRRTFKFYLQLLKNLKTSWQITYSDRARCKLSNEDGYSHVRCVRELQ